MPGASYVHVQPDPQHTQHTHYHMRYTILSCARQRQLRVRVWARSREFQLYVMTAALCIPNVLIVLVTR